MDDFLGFGGLFDVDGDGTLDAGEMAFGLMMVDDALMGEDADDDPTEDTEDLQAIAFMDPHYPVLIYN